VEGSAHTDAEFDAAIEALSDPQHLEEAQRLVAERAPQLQRILDQALHAAGWFDEAHARAIRSAASVDDPAAREQSVRTLVEEETRVSMLTGVAVGYELANTLLRGAEGAPDSTTEER
jgi:hypothetical protein